MFTCPTCGSPRISAYRSHTVVEHFILDHVQPNGDYTEEASDFGDTITTGPWDSAVCVECDASLDLTTIFPCESPTDEEYRIQARDEYAKDGEIEIDGNAVVSRGNDPGAYVAAWVWVYNPDKDDEESEI